MRLLLETHIAIWAALTPDALTPDALTQAERSRMAEADVLVLSAVAVWELRLKWHTCPSPASERGRWTPPPWWRSLSRWTRNSCR